MKILNKSMKKVIFLGFPIFDDVRARYGVGVDDDFPVNTYCIEKR